ncbi:hypothetical protein FHG87_001695 [Trinorchestia longiramus]|nr:hypothetical protein FHG87_001695 [Trinorchestia longiramus]
MFTKRDNYSAVISITVFLYQENYRPIALADAVSKIFYGILNEWMKHVVEGQRVMGEDQNGFRKDKRGEDKICESEEELQRILEIVDGYSRDCKVKFGGDKSKVMVINGDETDRDREWNIGGNKMGRTKKDNLRHLVQLCYNYLAMSVKAAVAASSVPHDNFLYRMNTFGSHGDQEALGNAYSS